MLFTGKDSFEGILEKVTRELSNGAKEPSHQFHFANFATTGLEYPEVRTVVARRFDPAISCYFFTDFRSEKIAELQNNSNSALHFYHDSDRVQIRIKGKAMIHYQNEVSKEFWEHIEGKAKNAYTSKLNPGDEIKIPEAAFEWDEEFDDAYFAVVQLVASELEVLQLTGGEQLRVSFCKSNEKWKGTWLVP
jgi:hypothetical protein